MKRRNALKSLGAIGAGTLLPWNQYAKTISEPKFKISLAEWSFHKALWAKEMDHLEFAVKTSELGMNGVEYVNQFFADKAEETSYLNQMNQIASDHGVTQVLIMVDNEGYLGELDEAKRSEAVENHYKWVNAAKYLGCHSIRVNAFGKGSAEEVKTAAVDGLGRLSEYAAQENINVIVENHGSYSSVGSWLSAVIQQVNMSNCGTLPDFGNFCMKREGGAMWGAPCVEEYDKYKGVEEMMPFAKAVSAKAFDFDENGDEPNIDFYRMMKIVTDHGYSGFVGIEYEGDSMEEKDGIIATKKLLEKIANQ